MIGTGMLLFALFSLAHRREPEGINELSAPRGLQVLPEPRPGPELGFTPRANGGIAEPARAHRGALVGFVK
eukprot:6120322-Alexandrium_andersonii.AAC.1